MQAERTRTDERPRDDLTLPTDRKRSGGAWASRTQVQPFLSHSQRCARRTSTEQQGVIAIYNDTALHNGIANGQTEARPHGSGEWEPCASMHTATDNRETHRSLILVKSPCVLKKGLRLHAPAPRSSLSITFFNMPAIYPRRSAGLRLNHTTIVHLAVDILSTQSSLAN